jgi:hypothetical protein
MLEKLNNLKAFVSKKIKEPELDSHNQDKVTMPWQ